MNYLEARSGSKQGISLDTCVFVCVCVCLYVARRGGRLCVVMPICTPLDPRIGAEACDVSVWVWIWTWMSVSRVHVCAFRCFERDALPTCGREDDAEIKGDDACQGLEHLTVFTAGCSRPTSSPWRRPRSMRRSASSPSMLSSSCSSALERTSQSGSINARLNDA